MNFALDEKLLKHVGQVLASRHNLFWIVGGAGSGKTTICQLLSEQFDAEIYDMDAHIYGSYHKRFSKERHPTNHAWANAPNGLQWFLNMTWNQFYDFNRAALPEYLDLLAEDMQRNTIENTVLVDGGIFIPSLLAQVLPKGQIVCLVASEESIRNLWEENAERLEMKELVHRLPNPDNAWDRFIEFDRRINETLIVESADVNITVVTREATATEVDIRDKVSRALDL